MAISFPISVSTMWNVLRASSVRFSLGEAMSAAETGDGEILTSRRGNRLWSGDMIVMPDQAFDQDAAVALVDIIRQAGASFMVYDRKHPFPRNDPSGTVAAANTATIQAIAANRRDVTFAGMPFGYRLSAGDMVSISYNTNPVRHYVGRVFAGNTFSPACLVEMVPPLPAGITTAGVVSLVRPACKAVYVPNSFEPPRRKGGLDTGFSFAWRQTLR